MEQSQRQTADLQGYGNVVVQIIGDGNVASLAVQLPGLWLTTYDSPLYAEVQSVPPEAGRLGGYTATGLEEAGLLSPFTRSLTMLGREQALLDLINWLEAPQPISVQVVVGGGGRGKTRLALELCAAARDRGWLAGFVARDELTRFRAQRAVATWGWNRPVIAVVDYAAAKAGELAGWLAELTHHPCWTQQRYPTLRLLLLERHGARADTWWRQAFGEGGPVADATRRMLAPGAPIALGPLRSPDQRAAVFAEAYCLAAGASPPRIASLDRLLEVQSLGGEPLFLAMAGLSAARIGVEPALAQTPDELAINLARQELSRVRAIWASRGLPISDEKRLDHHLAAVATLREGLGEEDAHTVIARECEALHLLPTHGTESIRAALHAALPADAGGIAPILPDILGEAAMIAAWGESRQGTDTVRRAATERRELVTRVVIRACQDFLVRGQRAPLGWLQALRTSATELDTLMRLADAMPGHTTELREIALEVAQAVVHAIGSTTDQGRNDPAWLALRATSLNNLSVRLVDLGRREGALAAIEEAVAIRRVLAAGQPDAFGPDLASSLTNLSVCLSDLGRRESALTAGEEAVATYRSLATDRPRAFPSELSASLNNLSGRLADLGRREAALAAIEEAVAIRREVAAERPDAFGSDLAQSLNNMSVHLLGLGRRAAALRASEEAVAIYRALAAERLDAFGPDLAGSLTNLSVFLSKLGQREAALAAIDEAVATYRTLATVRPRAFRPDLARSLNNLSVHLSSLGRREVALAAIEEAVTIRRELVAHRSDVFGPELAESLSNLSSRQGDLGRCEEALATAEEAVTIFRVLATQHPAAFLPGLGASLDILSNRLADLGRTEEALATAEGAIAIQRTLAVERPEAFGPELARSLSNLSNRLGALGRDDEGLAAVEEAVATYRALATARPDAFGPDLATSLNNFSVRLSGLGRHEPALVASEEAVRILRGLAAERPDAFRPDLASALNNLSGRLSGFGRPEAALMASEEAVGIYRALATERPNTFAPNLASALGMFGRIASDQLAALSGFAEGIRVLSPLFRANPQAHAGLLRALSLDYLAACQRAAREPDPMLLLLISAVQ